MDFAHISYDDASFLILENFVWMPLVCFLAKIAIWFVKYFFSTYGETLS